MNVKLAPKSAPPSRIASPRRARRRYDGIGPRVGWSEMIGGPNTQEMRTVDADSSYCVRYMLVSSSAHTLVVL